MRTAVRRSAGILVGRRAAVGLQRPNTEQWQVTLGSETLFTPVEDNVSHGFSGWLFETMGFTAASSSEPLSFLSVGTPNGVPPFALLDGVTLSQSTAPEPWRPCWEGSA